MLVICIDILGVTSTEAGWIFSGTFLGLIVGLLAAYALSFVVGLLVDQYLPEGLRSHQMMIIN